MAKHTPGPWHITGELGEWVNDKYQMNICRVNSTVSMGPNGVTRSDGTHSRDANARLIAAAPDLLEASIAIAKDLASYIEAFEIHTGSVEHSALGRLRAAIAKAEGGRG